MTARACRMLIGACNPMTHARFTTLGTPVGPAKESAGCCDKRNCPNLPKGMYNDFDMKFPRFSPLASASTSTIVPHAVIYIALLDVAHSSVRFWGAVTKLGASGPVSGHASLRPAPKRLPTTPPALPAWCGPTASTCRRRVARQKLTAAPKQATGRSDLCYASPRQRDDRGKTGAWMLFN